MKTIANKLLILMIILTAHESVLAQCDNCPAPQVVIYGVQMNVALPPPDDTTTGAYTTTGSLQALSSWSSLGNIVLALDSIAFKDPEDSCVNWTQVSTLDPSDTLLDSLTMANLEQYSAGDVPAAGTVAGVDYLIWATLDSSGGQYHFHVYLEDGYSRTRIDSAQGNFTYASDAVTAADSAVSRIEPVFDKIRAYQMNLRANGTNIAISPQITIVPSQQNMNALQTIPVTFQVNDCDGTPLQNRTLNIGGSNGSFDQSSVTTNNNGQATANFTAINTSDIGNLTAIYYPYTTATHQQRTATGGAFVYINDPNAQVWQLKVSEHYASSSLDQNPLSSGKYIYDLVSLRGFVNFTQFVTGTVTDTLINTNYIGGFGDATYSVYDKYIEEEDYYVNSTTVGGGGLSPDEKFTRDFLLGWDPNLSPHWLCASQIKLDGSESTTSFNKDKYGDITVYNGVTPDSDIYTIEAALQHATLSGNPSGYTFSGTYVTNTSAYAGNKYHSDWYITVSITPYTTPTAVSTVPNNIPNAYQLYANYPNPFNPSTMISYDIPVASNVNLTVYDILGREVQTLVNQKQNAGKYGVRFDASRLSSGVYFYRIVAGNYVATRKMAVLK